MAAAPWNHSIHYHPVVLREVPAGAERALDVGCGGGMLARELRRVVPQVTALDRDGPSLEAARKADDGLGVEYLLGDFLTYDFEPGTFDFVCAVAVLHHMDAARGLRRMSQLLRPGGRLAVIGCAKLGSLADLPAEIGGFVLHRMTVLHRQFAEISAPTCWPPPETYAGMRRIGREVLPGARYRRRLLWRYSLVWTKPAGGSGADQFQAA